MYDIIKMLQNLERVTTMGQVYESLIDFERVIDELGIYVYEHWEEGELLSGPNIGRHFVTCSFVWHKTEMPNPAGAVILSDHGCIVKYHRSHMLVPRKIKKPSDFRPGTKKGKLDHVPVWVVNISIPKTLMQDTKAGEDLKHGGNSDLYHIDDQEDQLMGNNQAESDFINQENDQPSPTE